MDDLKRKAAAQALEFVQDGMIVGLGTGSTTRFFVDLLGEALNAGRLADIRGVPTSLDTARQAQTLGISLTTLAEHPVLDLAVDGADEVDPSLDLIKGLGKALLREKVVEARARRFVVIVDESKLVSRLGRGPLPVEIVQFEAAAHVHWLAGLGCRAELWRDEAGAPYITDNGNYLARCWFAQGIADAGDLACQLDRQPGIVEHGLFLNMASIVIVAGAQGVRRLERRA